MGQRRRLFPDDGKAVGWQSGEVGGQTGRRAGQHDDAVGKTDRFGEIVGDEQRRHAGLPDETAHLTLQVAAQAEVLLGGLCQGCYRTLDEIKTWWDMGQEEQKNLLVALEERQLQQVNFD